jgi:hypothetical protein
VGDRASHSPPRGVPPIQLTIVQTTEKWPSEMSGHVESSMLQHRVFSVYKRRPTSVALINQIVHKLLPYFDAPLDRHHLAALVKKVEHKIIRTRSDLLGRGALIRTATGFALTTDASADSAPDLVHTNPRCWQEIEHWIQQNSPHISSSDSDYIITLFLNAVDHLSLRRASREASASSRPTPTAT